MPQELILLPLESRASKQGSSGIANPSQWLVDWMGAAKSVTGIDVHETVAMQANAVYACVLVLSETMGTIPLVLYRYRDDGGKERAPQHPLYRLLHDAPNPEMTSVDFRQCMMGHRLLWGNAYAEIERDVSGRPIALWPLRPDRMNIWRSFDSKQLEYWYSLYTGGVAVLPPENVLHIKNMSIDGIRGMSPIAWQRESVATEMALEQFGNSFFGNDASPGGFLSHPGQLNDKARDNLKKGWEAAHMGLTQKHRVAILEEGVTWQKVGVPPEDAQFLATRQFSLTAIARIYRVPMHLLSELGRVTHANIEHMGIDFVTHTIRPHCVNWEQAIQQKLISATEAASYFAEFNIEGLLRGDLASRFQSYAIGRQWGWLSPNEIRDKENENPISDKDGGNDYLIPMNMGTKQQAITAQAAQGAPADNKGPSDTEDPSNRGLVWQRLFKRELETILRREKVDVLKSARKMLEHQNLRGLQRWLVTFYGDEHPKWMQERLLTLFEPEEEAFAKAFLEDFALRHSQRSLQAVQEVLLSQNGESVPALEAKFGEWEGSRALETVKTEHFRLRIVPELRQAPVAAPQPQITVQGPQITFPEGFMRAEIAVQAPPVPSVMVNNEVQAAQAPLVTVPVTVEASPAPEVSVNNTFQPPPAPSVEVDVQNTFQPPPTPEVTVNNTVEAASAPQVTVQNTYEGDQTIIQPAPAPDVTVQNTFQAPNVEVMAPVIDVKAPITVENTFQPPNIINQVQQPDVTVMPTEHITITAPAAPEPRAKPKALPPKLKAQKARLRKKG